MSENRYVKLRMLIEEQGVEHQQLADIIGVTKSTFSNKINRTGSRFTLEEASKIARFFNRRIEDIF